MDSEKEVSAEGLSSQVEKVNEDNLHKKSVVQNEQNSVDQEAGGDSLSGKKGNHDNYVKCTACGHQLNCKYPGKFKPHPVLKVLICKKCHEYYERGPFTQDDAGIDEQCRWCGECGELLECDGCHNVFCKSCVERNLGKEIYTEISTTEDWKCFVCNTEPIEALQEMCKTIMNSDAENEDGKTENHQEDHEKTEGNENGEDESKKDKCIKSLIKKKDEKPTKEKDLESPRKKGRKQSRDNEVEDGEGKLKDDKVTNTPEKRRTRNRSLEKEQEDTDVALRSNDDKGNLIEENGDEKTSDVECSEVTPIQEKDGDDMEVEDDASKADKNKKASLKCKSTRRSVEKMDTTDPEDGATSDKDTRTKTPVKKKNKLEREEDDVTDKQSDEDNGESDTALPAFNCTADTEKDSEEKDDGQVEEEDETGQKDKRSSLKKDRKKKDGLSEKDQQKRKSVRGSQRKQSDEKEEMEEDADKEGGDGNKEPHMKEKNIKTPVKKKGKKQSEKDVEEKDEKENESEDNDSAEKSKQKENGEKEENHEHEDEMSAEEGDHTVGEKDDRPALDSKDQKCTACGCKIDCRDSKRIKQHPVLKVLLCQKCSKFYNSGPIKQDEDGIDEQCRWCAEGGVLIGCDACSNAFCKSCITRNFDKTAFKEIEKKKYWKCYVCDPSPLKCLQEDYEELLKRSKSEPEIEMEDTPKKKKKDDVECTACGQLIHTSDDPNRVKQHPTLNVLVCKKCYGYCNSVEITRHGDGNDEQCRWCGLDGQLVKCTKCTNSFCESCIKRNLDEKRLLDIQLDEEWECFVCQPETIQELQVNCVLVRSKMKELPVKRQAENDDVSVSSTSTPPPSKRTSTEPSKLLEDVKCTACAFKFKHYCDIREHPELKVITCATCYEFYKSGTIKQDEDGVDEQCRWCAEGGNLLGCDNCHNTFCKKCIVRNFGRDTFKEIEKGDYWKCFVCNNEPMKELQEKCKTIIESDLHPEEKSATKKAKEKATPKRSKDKQTDQSVKKRKNEKELENDDNLHKKSVVQNEQNSVEQEAGGDSLSGKKESSELLKDLRCTTCGKDIVKPTSKNVMAHPVLNVIVCNKCHQFYKSDAIKQDEDGVDEQCRWCAEGGSLLGCDNCHNTFCKKCIVRNFSKETFKEIEKKKYWKCFACNEKPLKELQERCTAIQNELKPVVKETPKSSKDKKSDDADKLDDTIEDEIVDENDIEMKESSDHSGELMCTACGEEIDQLDTANVMKHPVLKVIVCKKCHKLYKKAVIKKDADGLDEHCRWCALGIDLVGCNNCHNVFCDECISRNLNEETLQEIKKKDNWKCFVCDDGPLKDLREKYHEIHSEHGSPKKDEVKGEKEKKADEKIIDITEDEDDDESGIEIIETKEPSKDLSCTSCGKEIREPDAKNVKKHPALNVIICGKCHKFYKSGTIKKDEDGVDEQCRWCAEGGNLLGCDNCHNTFCKKCIVRNFSKDTFKEIEKKKYWKCFVCNDKPMKELQKKCNETFDELNLTDKDITPKSKGKEKDEVEEDKEENAPHDEESNVEMAEASEILKDLMCTACGNDIRKPDSKNVMVHPALNVIMCKKCHKFYKSGTIKKDEDGVDEQCRWCAEGGNLLGCDNCHNTICKKCIVRNFSKDKFKEIEKKKYWKCFVCNETPLKELQGKCKDVQKTLHTTEIDTPKKNRDNIDEAVELDEAVEDKKDDGEESEMDEMQELLMNLPCTACGHEIEEPDNKNVMIHPVLHVIVCEDCFNHQIALDDDDIDDVCTWCKQHRRELVECDECCNAFCKLCIVRNFSKSEYREILTKKVWKCYVCKPRILKMAEIKETCQKIKKYLKLPEVVTTNEGERTDIQKRKELNKKNAESKKKEEKRKEDEKLKQKNKKEADKKTPKQAEKKVSRKSVRDDDQQDEKEKTEDDVNQKLLASLREGASSSDHCVVCDDHPTGFHYGVEICEACRVFFKKSIQKDMKYQCRNSKKCLIKESSRNHCHFCHLQKCFKMGLSKEDDEDIWNNVLCTACGSNVDENNFQQHPKLNVLICNRCSRIYKSGLFKQDSDGKDEQCQWCTERANLVSCDVCHYAFCKTCIKRNFGIHTVKSIESKKLWKCLVCDSSPLKEIQAEFETIKTKLMKSSNSQFTKLKIPEAIYIDPNNIDMVLEKLKLASRTFSVLLDKIDGDLTGSQNQKNLQKHSMNLAKEGCTRILTTGVKLLLDSFSNILSASYVKQDKKNGAKTSSEASRRDSLAGSSSRGGGGKSTSECDDLPAVDFNSDQKRKRKGQSSGTPGNKTKRAKPSNKSTADSDEESVDSEAEVAVKRSLQSPREKNEITFSDSDSDLDGDITHLAKNISTKMDSAKKDDVWWNVVVGNAKNSDKQDSVSKSKPTASKDGTRSTSKSKEDSQKRKSKTVEHSDNEEDLNKENEAAKRALLKQLSELESSDEEIAGHGKKVSKSTSGKASSKNTKKDTRKSTSSHKKKDSDDESDMDVQEKPKSKKRKMSVESIDEDELPLIPRPKRKSKAPITHVDSDDEDSDENCDKQDRKQKRRSTRKK